MSTTERDPAARTRAAPIVPSVLVILVAKDGEPWLRATLAALAKQDHPRLGVIAVDNASTDGTSEILKNMLGQSRMVRLPRNRGFPAAVREALDVAGTAAEADYLLLLHDDTILAPDAISCMVQAAEQVDGTGVVGPKVVDWEDPHILREVGLSADRFGYPYSPLEEEELDQGQYDRAREVLFVSSSAMLVSRDAWRRAGLPDERYGSHFEDLDFCWRARLAGFRVLMNPRAVARHRGASFRSERRGTLAAERSRYFAERASLASLLKNYGLLNLLWVVPLYMAAGVGRVGLYLFERRFDEAWQIVAAWGWNLLHLPGTVRRRIRSQAVRTVPDREIRRFMAPAGVRVRRFAQRASTLIWGREGRFDEDDILERPPVRTRARAYALSHPVVVAWALGALVAFVAYRNLLGASPLDGGALAAPPARAVDLFKAFASGWRETGLGGAAPASPALVVLGVGSVISFGSAALFQKVFLLALPALAGVSMFRAVVLLTRERRAAVIAAACYTLSAATLAAFSEGRIDHLILLAVAPWLGHRLWASFGDEVRAHPTRWIVGAGAGLALGTAFFPGVALAAALLLLTGFLVPAKGGRRSFGLRTGFGAALVAAVLLFPNALELARTPSAFGDPSPQARFGELARVAIGHGPGTWVLAFFLPLAAALSFAFVAEADLRWAVRSVVAAVAGLALSWASTAGYLPVALANAPAYLAVTAFSYCVLIGLGFRSLLPGMQRHAFGARQLGFVLLWGVVGFGLLAQAASAAAGDWSVGEGRLPAAWPVVSDASPGTGFRVLWLGSPKGAAFAPPGGVPNGVAGAGAASVRYAVTGRDGASPYDVARPAAGPGYPALARTLQASLAGEVRHLGASLAPFGIRFVVAGIGDLPSATAARLERQVDLNLIQHAGGLSIYANARALPPAVVVDGASFLRAARSGDPLAAAAADPPMGKEMAPVGTASFAGSGSAEGQAAYLGDSFDAGWKLQGATGPSVGPERVFGWSMLFPDAPGGPFALRYGRQWVRTIELVGLAIVWAAALWVTRRPPRVAGP